VDRLNLLMEQAVVDSARDVVQKLWSYCNILRDDGLSYPDYVEQLTYLLFLKMADEQAIPGSSNKALLPKGLNWRSLSAKRGAELAAHYSDLLAQLGKQPGMLGTIFADARNKIRDPEKLRLLVVDLIGSREWNSLEFDVKGTAYEGLLEKNAQDTKSGAGQYFTPRPLVDAIVGCIRPRPGEVINDPACGTGGFLISAYQFIVKNNAPLSRAQMEHLRLHAIRGSELVAEVTRLATMNLLLHGIGPTAGTGDVPVVTEDSLAVVPRSNYDVVITNPPFGVRSSTRLLASEGEGKARQQPTILRPDLWVSTANKELNFLQHIANTLRPGGRAAVVVPDGVLSGSGPGAVIRGRLLSEFDVHTLLRLPPGLFYAQGVMANVLFFDRPTLKLPTIFDRRQLWVYDLRAEMRFSLMSNRFGRSDIAEFESLYCGDDRSQRQATWSTDRPNGRWRPFDLDEIVERSDFDLNLSWIRASGVDAGDVDSATLMASIVSDLQVALAHASELVRETEDRSAD
jgi:type I restriction enzyme M protein